jgi:CheY-like chemotaxis protein
MPLDDGDADDRRVLIIDDDQGTRDTFGPALRLEGFRVTSVSSGEEGLAIVDGGLFHSIVVDLRLPGLSGVEVIRELMSAHVAVPIVVVSAYVTVEVAVESMKLGVFDVLEKPVELDHLAKVIRLAVNGPDGLVWSPSCTKASNGATASLSIVRRWSGYVIEACSAPEDLKTLETWARHVAVSYSTLCECCRFLAIRPLDARDFARVLRALRLAHENRCRPQIFLDVSDTRTLRALSVRSGVDLGSPATGNVAYRFLASQSFVAATNEALPAIRAFLASWSRRRGNSTARK